MFANDNVENYKIRKSTSCKMEGSCRLVTLFCFGFRINIFNKPYIIVVLLRTTGTYYCAMCNMHTQDEWMIRCSPLRTFEWNSVSGLCFLSCNVCVIGKICAHLKCGTGWDFTAVTRGWQCAQVVVIVEAPVYGFAWIKMPVGLLSHRMDTELTIFYHLTYTVDKIWEVTF